ncbi:anthranilate phosphoribosyltransferase [Lysinibacillus sp. 2017]|uniref:anthranilate phosphoribosyltransferase n=1 Tax=unclassified Lysinibacillus TaxID=2636778 RepID=UPI000D527566|nr:MULTISPECIES: anthranilate phosphoribosyltransferase [unclassified Lysinibacillus]AWE06231.1 anthranilate phosphoribosyltransferase [Lysinibacillus sp. 2017]TGN35293.1 anthranilate phosphoribosyltransferase [Lysinibacillus sp. S2017]
MSLTSYIHQLQRGKHLDFNDMQQAAQLLFDEQTPKEQIATFLLAMNKKGETAHEVAGLAAVMKSHAVTIDAPEGIYIDNCGTGGDGLQSFNISTTAAFVLAGGGILIAKHGNRKISSASGSSDVLEALGIALLPNTAQTTELLKQQGIAFLHAPNMHPKLKRIGEVRQTIGKPTIFNLVGPLTNPVPLKTQFVGINRPNFTTDYAEVLHLLGRERAIVVSGAKGMDEASLDGENTFVLLDHGDIIPFKLRAEDVGLQAQPLSAIRGGNPTENAQIMRELLQGKQSAYFDTVVLNAGIGFFAYGLADTMKEGIEMAKDSIISGRAYEKLEHVAAYSQKTLQEESMK